MAHVGNVKHKEFLVALVHKFNKKGVGMGLCTNGADYTKDYDKTYKKDDVKFHECKG